MEVIKGYVNVLKKSAVVLTIKSESRDYISKTAISIFEKTCSALDIRQPYLNKTSSALELQSMKVLYCTLVLS